MVLSIRGALNPWWNSIHDGAQSMVELNPWWAPALLPVDTQCQGAPGTGIFGYLSGLGVVVPLLCSHLLKFCAQEWRMETDLGYPNPRGWSVEFAPEMAEPLPGSSRVLWQGTSEHLCHGGTKRPAHARAGHSQPFMQGKLLETLQLIQGSPGPPGEPITPPCSSSLLFKAVVQEEENPVLQLLPSAAGMWEGGGS